MLTASSDIDLGRTRLSPGRRLLVVGGEPVRIGSRAFDLLTLLCENVGSVVAKSRLIARAWPNTSADEAALRVQVVAIRKALAADPSLALQVVPGHGYRLTIAGIRASLGEAAKGDQSELPSNRHKIFGRDDIIRSLAAGLSRERLVSVVGPGGIGKTSVALEIGRRVEDRYPDGVVLVDLGAATSSRIVADTVARRLNLAVFSGNPVPGILAHLQDKRVLIILDTCEHVLDATAELSSSIVEATTGVCVLATSREPLHAKQEFVCRLPPLDLPAPDAENTLETVRRHAASEMLAERILSAGGGIARDDAAFVLDICRRVDGLPMAIEIVAAQVGMFGLEGVATQIGSHFALAARGRRTALARHQTLRATLDWSYGLLTPDERAALRCLSIFPAAFGLEEALRVIGTSAPGAKREAGWVASLVSKSLVTIAAGPFAAAGSDTRQEEWESRVAYGRGTFRSRSERRYKLLDTTRDYARAALDDSGDARGVAERHALLCLDLLRQSDDESAIPAGSTWLATFGGLLDDVRFALQWCFSHDGDAALGVELTASSVELWTRHALFEEHREIVEHAMRHLERLHLAGTATEMKLQLAIGNILYHNGGIARDAATAAAFRRAFVLARAFGTPSDRIKALSGICAQGISCGDYSGTHEFGDALAQVGGSLAHVASRSLAHNLLYMGRLRAARGVLETAIGNDQGQPAATKSGVHYNHMAVVDTVRARLTWLEGYPDDALRIACGAVEAAAASLPPISLCLTLATGALFVATMNGEDDATEHFLELLERHATRHSMRRWGEYASGYRLALVPCSERTPSEAERFSALVAQSNGALLESLAVLGADRTTPALIAKALGGQAGWCRPELIRVETVHLLSAGLLSPIEAESRLVRALESARSQGGRAWERRISTDLSALRQSGSPA